MKNKMLLLIVLILFAQLSVMEARSEFIYQTEVEEEIPVYIPDGRFLNRLILEGVDVNDDGLISYAEAEAVIQLDLGIENNCYPSPDMITFLQGIEAFVNLETLNLEGNLLSRLDLSNSPNLRVLTCKMNLLTGLDLSNNPMLQTLDCSWNNLTELDVTGSRYLEKLNCAHNQFSTINLSENLELTHLNTNSYKTEVMAMCASNRSGPATCTPLDYLDITNNTKLEYLMCCGVNFDELDLSNNTALKVIILVGMKGGFEVKVWCDPFPTSDIHLVEVYCDAAVTFTCPSEESSKGTVLAVDRRLASQVQIFPNPTADFINIETESNEVSLVNISSLNGQILHSEQFSGGSLNMDLGKYQKGMYLISVRSGGKAVTKKILLK